MDWSEQYKDKLLTAEEAAGVVKAGDRIAFALDVTGGPATIANALAARMGELKDVEIEVTSPGHNPGWYDPGWEHAFKLMPQGSIDGGAARPGVQERRVDYTPRQYSLWGKAHDERRPGIKEIDIFFVVLSPPDEHGYCSFGVDIWSKKWYARTAKKVIAEVDENAIRTYGENFIHASEIDCFVKTLVPRWTTPTPESIAAFKERSSQPIPEPIKAIGQNVGELIRDGDTFCIGAGKIGNTLCRQGIFDERIDLGYYAENMVQGIVGLVKAGVVTGKRKTFHPGKVVCNNFGTGNPGDLTYVAGNPMFELYPQDFILDIRNIAANDNMVVITAAMSIDLTGQIASESIGHVMYTGSGGQPDLVVGAMLSKGGRSITMIRSTTTDGQTSRITPSLDPGTVVTVARNWADYVVSEFGIASLQGKSQRERAQELIAIAHPDFRADLTDQAHRLYWP